MGETAGPMLLGFDVLWVATILSGIAAFAVMVAIYAATTVSDPMAKRVKALNDRREQLKAGITASTKRRAKLVQRHDAADRMRGWLSSMKVLQDSQVKAVQVKLAQAGKRAIQNRDIRAHSGGNPRRMGANNATADHEDARRQNTRNAAH